MLSLSFSYSNARENQTKQNHRGAPSIYYGIDNVDVYFSNFFIEIRIWLNFVIAQNQNQILTFKIFKNNNAVNKKFNFHMVDSN